MKNSVTRKWIDRCNIVSQCNKNSIHNLWRIAAKVELRTDSYLYGCRELPCTQLHKESWEYPQSSIIHTTFVRHNAQHSNSTTGICVAKTAIQFEENPSDLPHSIIDITHFLVFSHHLPAQDMFRFLTMAPVYKSEQPHSLYKPENQPFLLTSFSSVESIWFNIGHQLALISFHLSNGTNGHPISNLHYKSRFTHLFLL